MQDAVVILCNAVTDEIRTQRHILTDSPAASRKVFMMAEAIRQSSKRVVVLSLGRGRQDYSGKWFPATVKRVRGAPVIFHPFLNLPVLSELISLFAPVPTLWRMYRKRKNITVLFYNRTAAYAVALLCARLMGFRCLLDLEDGETPDSMRSFRGLATKAINFLYESCCSDGALLACEALKEQTRIRPTMCYYGAVEPLPNLADWQSPRLNILMSGTVSISTGALQLIGAIKILRMEYTSISQHIEVHVTGNGDCIEDLARLSMIHGGPTVTMHGRISNVAYRNILTHSHIGLALKPAVGELAHSTFPSKVTEMASAGLALITTDISDVRKIFGSAALYLENEDPRELVTRMVWAYSNRAQASSLAKQGKSKIAELCGLRNAGLQLLVMLEPRKP